MGHNGGVGRPWRCVETFIFSLPSCFRLTSCSTLEEVDVRLVADSDVAVLKQDLAQIS